MQTINLFECIYPFLFVCAYVCHIIPSLSVYFTIKSHHNFFLAYPTTIDGALVGPAIVGAAIGGAVVGAVGAISVAVCIVCYKKKKKV